MHYFVDSRQVEPGGVFCALKGERTDGHLYIEEAAKRGARAAVVDESYEGEAFGLDLIRVPAVRLALQAAAAERVRQLGKPIVGVTGSVGKTTTRNFISTLLGVRYKVNGHSANSQIGLPLTILGLDGDEDCLVLEMAMTEQGHIARLVEIAPPDIAVITNVSYVHAEYFNSIDEIAKAKAEILSAKTGLAILGEETPIEPTIPTVRLGRDYRYDGTLIYEGGEPAARLCFDLPFVENMLAAIAVARAMGLDWDEIREGVAQCKMPPMRLEKMEVQGVTLIKDCYNACAKSVCAALDHLPEGGQKIAVLSQMVEMGSFSQQEHERVARHALKSVDRLLCIGEEAKHMQAIWEAAGRPVAWFGDKKSLGKRLSEHAEPGDVVLVKGSRAFALEEIIDIFSNSIR